MAYIGKQPTVGNFVKLDAITTSATDTFNLTNGTVAYYPQSANHCIVSLNGVIQEPTSASNVGGFSISGSTIVFTSALTSNDVIDFILVLGDVLNIGTPSDATVGFAKVTSNLITGATAETSIAGGDSVLIYDDSASALRKMTRTNFVAGIGGANTPAFHVTRSTNQSIGDNSFDKIQLDSELFDTDNCFDNATNYRFTPTTAGKYFIYANVTINSNGDLNTLEGGVRIYKNGSIISDNAYDTRSNPMSYYNHYQQSQIINFNGTTDYVEMYGFTNDSSGTPTVIGDSTTNYTYFGGYKLIGV